MARPRMTKAETEAFCDALYLIVKEQQPMSVRGVFYQASVAGLVSKTDHGAGNGYAKVQRQLLKMRKDDRLPYSWITDGTRFRRQRSSYDDIEEALLNAAHFYRKNMWIKAPYHIEIWCEKDALSGVIAPVVDEFGLALMVSRGFSSATFLWQSAMEIEESEKQGIILHFGDYDPSGVSIGESIERGLAEHIDPDTFEFTRVAVNPDQIEEMDLPTRPTKMSDTRAANFVGDSVELDAIPAPVLRDMVRDEIMKYVNAREWKGLQLAEENERTLMRRLSYRDQDEIEEFLDAAE